MYLKLAHVFILSAGPVYGMCRKKYQSSIFLVNTSSNHQVKKKGMVLPSRRHKSSYLQGESLCKFFRR